MEVLEWMTECGGIDRDLFDPDNDVETSNYMPQHTHLGRQSWLRSNKDLVYLSG